MELANAWLILDKTGSNVKVYKITPAELVILIRDRQIFVGRVPIHNLKIIGSSSRSSSLERARLRAKYEGGLPDSKGKHVDRNKAKVDLLWPGEGTTLPEKFEDLDADMIRQCKSNNLIPPKADNPDWDEETLNKMDSKLAEKDTITESDEDEVPTEESVA